MKKKLTKIIGVALAAVLSLGLFAGCDLISTNNEADMAQVVAEVNISNDRDTLESSLKTLGGTLSSDVESNLNDILSTDEIYKRDLVAYFLSYGYNYVSQGSTYAQAFETIMNVLVERKVLVQFASVYYLSEGEIRVDPDFVDFPDGYTDDGDPDSDAVVLNDVTVAKYKEAVDAARADGASTDEIALAGLSVFLTEDEKNYAEYQVMQAINSSIDSYEQEIIAAEEGSTSSDTARTVPTGANETDTYYPMDNDGNLNYDVYTGIYNTVADCGEYEKVEGSSVVTRKRAYIRFLNSLNQNYLLSGNDVSSALEDIKNLSYYDIELRSQYEMLLINKFSATVALDMSDALINEDLTSRYESMKTSQQAASASGFVSTMDSMSDSSFVLYSPANRIYGFVYNILLPFSANQSLEITNLQNVLGAETREYYAARQSLFAGIEATDQRSSWFNGSEDYSFVATENGMTAGDDYYISEDAEGNRTNSDYLFFKDSFVAQGTRKADGIDRYAGKYPYNGTVVERADGTYLLTPEKLSIDDFIREMEGYINFVADGDAESGRASATEDKRSNFYNVTAASFGNSDNDINYEPTVYYKGKVDLTNTNGTAYSESDYMVEGTASYDVLSAVNELMFAYSTDTGCLNKYLGYSIASKEEATDYVAEFEYAAQDAITKGAGTYYVVATDFGWHIIYVSFVFEGGDTYADGFDYNARNDEGTFSYYFYQSMKSSVAQDYSQEMVDVIYNRMEQSDTVIKKYEDRYSDLTSIGA